MSARQEISINSDAIKDIALRGVRRAVAFLCLGLQATRNGLPTSVVLDSKFVIQWFPDPLPSELARELSGEYESWIIGSALKELDQYFGMFLNEIWGWMRMIEFHGKALPPGFGPDKKFIDDTNVARKLSHVEKSLGVKAGIGSDFFNDYSLARNALSHNVGIVRDRDANDAGMLVIRWHAPTLVIKSEGEEHIFDQTSGLTDRVFGAESQVVFRMRERSAKFVVGERIALSRFDLSEICFSYQNAADTLTKEFVEYLVAKGVILDTPVSA
jgi:hypothetical protein